MLNVTRLLCGTPAPGDDLRYGERRSKSRHVAGVHAKPIVVWNSTRRCNLHCAHCYTESLNQFYPGELTTAEGRDLIDDLAGFGVPVVLFSGGEPTTRTDLPTLVSRAIQGGIQPVLSTNGTLLTDSLVSGLWDAGLRRVGISLDGLEETHDKFRGSKGAFQAALDGIRRSIQAGMRVSVRVTLTQRNYEDLPGLFELAESEGVPRLCIYHLAYAGRGAKLLPFDLDSEERRKAVQFIFEKTLSVGNGENGMEVLTVDNHADAAFLMLWAQERLPERIEEIRGLLARNGGNSAGKGIACIDNVGDVHPDQFWWSRTLGNVRDDSFATIWGDAAHPFLAQLRDRKSLLPKRCQGCAWLSLCNGNLRVRAETATGDPWGMDPACYLTDQEVHVSAQ